MNETTTFPNGYALLVGVNLQEDPKLKNRQLFDVKNDVEAVEKVLKDLNLCAYKPENVEVLLGEESTKSNILKALRRLRTKAQADTSGNATVFIYFSGHGFRTDIQGVDTFYLIPYDTSVESDLEIDSTAIKDSDWVRQLSAIDAKRVLILMDCCHAGATDAKDGNNNAPANTSTESSGVTSKPILEIPNVLEKDSGNNNQPPPNSSTTSTAVTTKPIFEEMRLNSLNWGEGRCVLTSCRDNEKSYMTDGISIFTRHVVEALTGSALHRPDDKVVKTFQLMEHVAHEVPKTAEGVNKSQNPQFEHSGDNFPIAQLMGGKGLNGATPPTYQETIGGKTSREATPTTTNTIGSIGQNSTVIQGASGGNYTISNDYSKKTETNTTHNHGSTYNVDTSGSGNNVVVGENNQVSIDQSTKGGNPELTALFQGLYAQLPTLAASSSLSAQELQQDVQQIEVEVGKGEKASSDRLMPILSKLKKFAPPVLETVAAIIENPKVIVSEPLKMLAQMMKG